MPFSAGNAYSRVKNFVNGGNLLPTDLNGIQDDFGSAIQFGGLKIGDIKISALTGDFNWLYCDGTPITVASGYTSLRNILIAGGSLYGSDGSGNPRIPDMRGRVPVAPDGGAGRISANNTLGQTGGEQAHSLTLSEIPSHSHAINGDPSNTNDSRGVAYAQPNTTIGGNPPNNSSYPVQSAGGGGSHYNVQPYQCLNFFIRAI